MRFFAGLRGPPESDVEGRQSPQPSLVQASRSAFSFSAEGQTSDEDAAMLLKTFEARLTSARSPICRNAVGEISKSAYHLSELRGGARPANHLKFPRRRDREDKDQGAGGTESAGHG